MWDEEKFFSDFKNEAKQIEPDSEFVERLLSLPEEKEKKVFNFQMGYRVATVAFAAVLLCVIGIRFLPSGVTTLNVLISGVSIRTSVITPILGIKVSSLLLTYLPSNLFNYFNYIHRNRKF